MYLYNPENFDPLEVLPTSLHKFADDARYFVHKLYVGRVFNKRHKNTFIPLKTAYLRRIMSERKYTLIRTALIQSGTILTDGHWIRGKKAIGYMLGEQFDTTRHKRIEVTNARLSRKIKEFDGPTIKGEKLDTHKHLEKYLHEIKIDYDSAVLNIKNDFNCNEVAIAMIRNQDWFFVPDKYGRVHINITNLKSSLRKYLRCSGQALINIDIRNSQPLFLGILLLDYYTNRGRFSSSFNNLPPLYPLRCDISNTDVGNFINLVEAGNLYEYIANEAQMESQDRKHLKQKFFKEILFCRNKHYQTKSEKVFSTLFPEVYNIIRKLKQKDYTFLSKQLQRVESSFIINTVIRRCMNDYPDLPVFTIHDSIMTVQKASLVVKNIIMEEFLNYGVKPRLRLENYG